MAHQNLLPPQNPTFPPLTSPNLLTSFSPPPPRRGDPKSPNHQIMNISLEKKENCLAAISVIIPAEKVTEERSQIIKSFVSQARIPGYRPGKAPVSVIEKAHGEAVTQELESRLIQNSFQQALKENEDLRVLTVKNPENVTHMPDGSFSFSAELITAPDVTLPDYKGLNVEIPKLEVSDELVENQLSQIQQRFADYEDIDDRGAQEGDIAIIDYTATVDGKPLDEVGGEQAKPLASNEGYWVRIENEAFFPGFTDELIDTKEGDEKDITVTLPNDFPVEPLREQEAVFAVKVTGLKAETLPELNDEFASKVQPDSTIDELKELIKEDLELRANRQKEELKVNSVLDQLNQLCQFELPEEYLKAETQGQADSMVQEGMQNGMTEDQVSENQDALFQEAEARATNSLKTNFILTEISQAEDLKVENSEVLQRVTIMAKQAKKPVKGYMKELQKSGQLSNIRTNLLFSKTIDFLIEHANVTEVEEQQEEEKAAS